jgi:hypothetical protein
VAIVNVGETRAEAEGLEGVFKIEAPIGDTLELCVKKMLCLYDREGDDTAHPASMRY